MRFGLVACTWRLASDLRKEMITFCLLLGTLMDCMYCVSNIKKK